MEDGTYSVHLDGGGRGKAATQAQAGAMIDGTSIYRPTLVG